MIKFHESYYVTEQSWKQLPAKYSRKNKAHGSKIALATSS